MNPLQLRREIEDEMKRTRLDKDRLFNLLLKIVDAGVGGGEGVQGPAGPVGECKCKCTAGATTTKKSTTTSTRKKAASATEK